MNNKLDAISQQVSSGRNYDRPPLHLWNPELSGDIDICILENGSWLHQGEEIRRSALVKLFASILRREPDGEYYLVTPVEKWRIQVQAHALQVIDVERRASDQLLQARLNTGAEVIIGDDYKLSQESTQQGVAVLSLWHGLTALFSRNAWYRLVELADDAGRLTSGNYSYSLA